MIIVEKLFVSVFLGGKYKVKYSENKQKSKKKHFFDAF